MRLAAAVIAAVALAGCGDGADTDGPPRPPEPRGEQQAVRDWIDALNDERYERAASFFAAGAIVEQTREIRLRDLDDAIEFNRSLPCKAEVTDFDDEGDTLLAAFRLSGGPGGGCDGGSARVRFRFRDGKFSEWRQLSDPATPRNVI